MTFPPPRTLRMSPKRSNTGPTQLNLKMRPPDGYPEWLRRSAVEGATVGLGFACSEEMLVSRSKGGNGTIRDPLEDFLRMPNRPSSAGPRPLLLGACIAHSTPLLCTDGTYASFSEPGTPSSSSTRWSSSTPPLTPATPQHQHSVSSLANAEAEIVALKFALSASSTMIKNLTKEKYDAVVASRRLAEALKGKQEAEQTWLCEKARLEERIKTLETVAAILDAEGQSLGRQTAHEASKHGRPLLESMDDISSPDTTISGMRSPQGPLQALRKLDPNFRMSSPSPSPRKPGGVLAALENLSSLLLGGGISPSPSYSSATSEEGSVYSAPSQYEEEHSYTGPPLPTSGRAVDFIMSFIAENANSSRDWSRVDERSVRPPSMDHESVSEEFEPQDDIAFVHSNCVDLSWIADAITDVAPLNIAPRNNIRHLEPVTEDPQGESIFATAEDLQESMVRVAAALGRPRTAGQYLEDIVEEDVEAPDQVPVSEDDPSPGSPDRFSRLLQCAARAACKKRAEAEVSKTKYYFDALRNSESQLSP